MEESVPVLDPETMQPVPADGATIGEVMFRGNITMKGYLKNPAATRGLRRRLVPLGRPGGRLPRRLPAHQGSQQGHHHLRRREHQFDRGRGRAVSASGGDDRGGGGAAPDPKWGEVPCAFIETRDDAGSLPTSWLAHCRAHLAGFKMPKKFVFGPVPKTNTGKIQKFLLRQQAVGRRDRRLDRRRATTVFARRTR
jgi:fatty-acyl-CoA synthase